MAANSGYLVSSLIEGGLSPAAAAIIANALANAASPQFSSGNDRVDSTPAEQLRLITPDTRRYQLTNLDYTPAEPFQKRLSGNVNAYAGGPSDHPYKDSQPVSPTPPLAQPAVRGSDYITVNNIVERNSNISEVSLDLRRDTGGRHLRLDPSTKSIEAVPLLAKPEVPRYLASEFRETENGTELVHGLRNLATMTVALNSGNSRQITAFGEGDAVLNGAFGGWGNWTPTVGAANGPLTIGYSVRIGRYFRIGALVFIYAEITLDATAITWPSTGAGASQGLRISAPFPCVGSVIGSPARNEYRYPLYVGAQSGWLTNYPVGGFVATNNNGIPQIYLRTLDGTSITFLNAQQGSNLTISGFYQAPATADLTITPVGIAFD
jgi:hypothetical protein